MPSAARIALAAALAGLALAGCYRRHEASAPGEERQLQIAPAKPAPPAEPPAPASREAKAKPAAVSNTVDAVQDAPLQPDEQVQEDAAASGMTSRAAGAATTDRASSMSNLY